MCVSNSLLKFLSENLLIFKCLLASFCTTSIVCVVAAEAQQPLDLSHILRVEMVVEFDGERVVFDDLIFCGERQKGTLTTRPVTQIRASRRHVTKVLSDGSMLGFQVPWLFCSMVAYRFDPRVQEGREYRAPEGWLPIMHWFDTSDPATKNHGEMYIAKSYYEAPFARLKIVEPISFSVPEHPFSKDLLAEAYAQEDAENVRRFSELERRYSRLIADGSFSFVEEAEWRDKDTLDARWKKLGPPDLGEADWDRFYALLDSIPAERGLVSLQGPELDDWTKPIFIELFRFNRANISRLIDYGVPQPGLKWDGFLAKFQEHETVMSDRVHPLTCLSNGVVAPDFQRWGMKYYRRNPCGKIGVGKWLEIDGARLPWSFSVVSKFYDARTKRIYRTGR